MGEGSDPCLPACVPDDVMRRPPPHSPQVVQVIADIPRHYQDVLLVGRGGELPDPAQVLRVVCVQVAHREDTERALE